MNGSAIVTFLPPQIGRFRFDSGHPGQGGRYISPARQVVIVSTNREADGKRWLHVSTPFQDRLPTYEELCEVKNIFVGPDAKAVQVFPPEAEHCNVHPYCLHLWACIDEDPLPDFRGPGGMV